MSCFSHQTFLRAMRATPVHCMHPHGDRRLLNKPIRRGH